MGCDLDIPVLSSWQDDFHWPADAASALSLADFRQIRALIPENVLLLVSPVRNWLAEIDPVEQDFVKASVPQRQAEFATGRMLAALALDRFGRRIQPIGQGAVKEPVWPEGISGSITHTRKVCMVALAASSDYPGVGIDLESHRDEFEGIGRMILRPEETVPDPARRLPEIDAVRLVFSAKEAIYKAIYGRVGRFVDFHEVRTEIRAPTAHYTATAPEDPVLDRVIQGGTGRIIETGDLVFALWH